MVRAEAGVTPRPLIHLIVQYFRDPSQQRAEEYHECLRRNLANPWIERVYNLSETAESAAPEEFRGHPKLAEIPLGRGLRYGDVVDFAAATLAGKIVAFSNLDIFLDPTSNWAAVEILTEQPIVLCLSRTDLRPDGTTSRDARSAQIWFGNSQDAWLFRAPIKVPDCDFELGIVGCDNAFAHRVKRAGYVPLNVGGTLRAMHLHADRQPRSRPEHTRRPEREGQYLVPDFDVLRSVDAILAAVNANDLQRYVIICDVLNRVMSVRNSDGAKILGNDL
jgi:hypothetical protein